MSGAANYTSTDNTNEKCIEDKELRHRNHFIGNNSAIALNR